MLSFFKKQKGSSWCQMWRRERRSASTTWHSSTGPTSGGRSSRKGQLSLEIETRENSRNEIPPTPPPPPTRVILNMRGNPAYVAQNSSCTFYNHHLNRFGVTATITNSRTLSRVEQVSNLHSPLFSRWSFLYD